jgi:hypothetical protein
MGDICAVSITIAKKSGGKISADQPTGANVLHQFVVKIFQSKQATLGTRIDRWFGAVQAFRFWEKGAIMDIKPNPDSFLEHKAMMEKLITYGKRLEKEAKVAYGNEPNRDGNSVEDIETFLNLLELDFGMHHLPVDSKDEAALLKAVFNA